MRRPLSPELHQRSRGVRSTTTWRQQRRRLVSLTLQTDAAYQLSLDIPVSFSEISHSLRAASMFSEASDGCTKRELAK